MRVTIKDVAKLAGVGTTTVSRVLNNPETVRPETRERVLDAIRRLNYTPNIAARMLIRGEKTPPLGRHDAVFMILGSEVSSWQAYWSPLVTLVMDELKRYGFDVAIGAHSFGGPSVPDAQPPAQLATGLGIVVVGQVPTDYLERLVRFGIPVVAVETLGTVDGIDYVLSDKVEGVRKATLHMAALGHRRIGLITGPESSQFAQQMEQGYRYGLADAGITPDPELICRGDFSAAGGHEAMRKLLHLASPPTAVVTIDEMSIGAMEVIREFGLSVPGDISMIGYDGLNVAAHLDPPLTTLRSPKESLARIAVKKLREALRDGKEHVPTKTLLPVELIERESTRAVNVEVGDWRVEGGSLKILDQSIWNTNAWFEKVQAGRKITYVWQMEFLATSAAWGPAGGLHILASDPTDYSRGVSYLIFQDGEAVRIYKARYDLNEMASFPVGARTGATYRYKVIVDTEEGRISVWRDDVWLGEWKDPEPITSGKYISVRTNRTSVVVQGIDVHCEA